MNRSADNPDFIKGVNYPRQTYALSGTQWGDSKNSPTRGKFPTDGPPMVISPQPPGAFAFDDEAWKSTFGASQDSYLSLINGQKLKSNYDDASEQSAPYNGIPTAKTHALYEKLGEVQQVQYVVSKGTVEDASNAIEFGDMSEVRSIGLRLPMHAAGWGYTTALRPTDPEPLDSRINDDEHKLDRFTWKEGPIDMRWDSDRKIWRTFNDLIADHYSKDIGTFVHGTVNDKPRGFPFQRGKLQDVWWVRQTEQTVPALGNNDDTTQTAEVCTTLKHKLYDPNENGAGPLWDVFICHQGSPVTLGTETTLIGDTAEAPLDDGIDSLDAANGDIKPTLEVRTTTWFHYSDALHGPCDFTEEGVTETDQVGRFKFEEGVWKPVVDFDFSKVDNLCANLTYKLHSRRHYLNAKQSTENGTFDLQSMVCSWNEPYTGCIIDHFNWVGFNANSAVYSLNNTLPPYILNTINQLAVNISASLTIGLQSVQSNMLGVINSLISQIQGCFAQLEIVCPLELPTIPRPFAPPIEVSVEEYTVPGIAPPPCSIDSFAFWQDENDEELKVTLIDPCGINESLVASCGSFATPDNPDGEIESPKTSENQINFGNPEDTQPAVPVYDS